MANPALLNNVDHKDLRIITSRARQYGDAVMSTLTFPAEFRDLQAHYPIVFRKTADGTSFEPLALFGFQEEENLFLSSDAWDASYVPLLIQRQPLLIGKVGDELMMNIDLDHPRVNKTEGEFLFLPHGGISEFLERMNSILLQIHEGLQSTPAFVAALMEHQLLESFVLDVELADGSQNRLAGFYTINEEKLHGLPGSVLERFNQLGYLQAIYMVIASISNFRALIERKNR